MLADCQSGDVCTDPVDRALWVCSGDRGDGFDRRVRLMVRTATALNSGMVR
jgi:hypothetical protein